MATQKSSPAPTPAAAPAPALGSYVVGATPILQGAQRFEPGAVIELTAAQAQRLGLAQAAAPTPATSE